MTPNSHTARSSSHPGSRFSGLRLVLLASTLPLLLAGCDESATGPGEDAGPPEITVDASSDWTYVDLDEEASSISVANPGESPAWDMAFFTTSVSLNGGDAGPAGVQGYCVCNNDGLSDAEVMDLEEQDGLDAFEAVTVADAPTSEDEWVDDALDPAIDGWYSYNSQTHVVSADPDAVWKVRTAEGTGFAKLHVTDITDPTQQHAGEVTLEFATQSESGGTMGGDQALTVDLSQGAAYVDLRDGAVSDESEWDLRLEGYTIQVNGGVSGDGEAGASRASEAYDDIADASDLSSRHYRGDAFGGVFASDEAGVQWYRYDLDGQHQIWPTYNVYLVRRDSELFKIQLVSYYSDTGDPRHITLRYELLEE
ncbi:MAG: HmuY family protein [Gemmatimonadota bacterium]